MTTLAPAFCAPQWHRVPEHAETYGPEVADLAAAVEMPLDPEQRLVTDAFFAVDGKDRLVATEVGVAAPRQNVKTHVAKASALADLVLFREPQGLWTAHLKETAYDAFRNPDGTGIADMFDNFDWLRRLVEEIRDSTEEVSITLRPESAGMPRPKLRFKTRSESGGGRGLSGRRVTFDEALYLKPIHTAAMIPVLSARSMSGQVQVRYLGSPGLKSSQVWRDVRNRGRAGESRALAWIEWAASKVRVPCESAECGHQRGTPGCALDREDLIRAGNLAIGRRMDIRYVMETERDALTPEDYMRERMGWWDDPPEGGGVFDLAAWDAMAVGNQRPVEPVLAVEIGLERAHAVIGAAWRIGEHRHLERVQAGQGADWVGPRAIELATRYEVPRVILDGGTEAAGLQADLEAAGIEVEMVSGTKRADVCGGFHDAALAKALTHNGDPAIRDAIAAARWKDVGEGARVFSRRKSAGDISSLYAVALALWGLEEVERCAAPNVW